ncbi:MAG: PIN domain-containing protein [Thaumarchaeota archaeon]|nr:PIN domain-containing protein [Nitrososphaerota archaeon]
MTLTSRLVVDSWAWIEYFGGSTSGRVVDRMMSDAEIWTSVISITEIVSKYHRKGIDESKAMETIFAISRTDSPDREDAREAGRMHAEVKAKSPNFGLADSFVLQLARKFGGKVVTGDPDFRGVKEAQLI